MLQTKEHGERTAACRVVMERPEGFMRRLKQELRVCRKGQQLENTGTYLFWRFSGKISFSAQMKHFFETFILSVFNTLLGTADNSSSLVEYRVLYGRNKQ